MHKEIQVSFEIRDDKEQGHRKGITSLQLDTVQEKLYSSSRDNSIRVWNTSSGVQDRFIQSFEQHNHWVNDIVLCCGGEHLISASSDTTIKLWNAANGNYTVSLPHHSDCVYALAYAEDREMLASGGKDGAIFLWDVNTLTRLNTTDNSFGPSSLTRNKKPIRTLVMNPTGNILVTGAEENIIRIWDPSTHSKKWILKSQTDTINALVVSRDGQQTLAGSSDGTIKLWSLIQQKCVSTIKVHCGQVTALLATENFSHVISGGSDKRVIVTDLKETRNSVVICEETATISKLCFTADQCGIWVSTLKSDLRCWELPPLSDLGNYMNTHNNGDSKNIYRTSAITHITGTPAVTEFKVLKNERHILTKDTANKIVLYDVLKASKMAEMNFREMQRRFDMTHVPKWFHVDVDSGVLRIHLRQRDPDCFGAWINGKEAGLTKDDSKEDNFGVLLLQALLERWKHLEEESKNRELCIGKRYFSVPLHTPVIFSEVDGASILKLQVREAAEENVSRILKKIMPEWVASVIENLEMPKVIKIPFYLLPYTEPSLNAITQKNDQDRIAVNDCTLCSKVAEHVLQRLYVDQCSLCKNGQDSDCIDECGLKSSKRVDFICNDQVLDLTMDLRTVVHRKWKSSEELTIYYKVIKA